MVAAEFNGAIREESMRILVVGSGGREHAMCWKLRQSPRVRALFCAPGNPGIATVAAPVPIGVDEIERLVAWAAEERIDLTIVGPEVPLSLGLVDVFQSRGLRIFGPTAAAARLESSKSFSKEIMTAAGVPTARYTVAASAAEAHACIDREGGRIVLKADGLAAGKGVVVASSEAEARAAVEALFAEHRQARLVLEQRLEGPEASFIIATDGVQIIPLSTAHDYKRILDGDRGPNTGGMGTVAPTPHLSPDQERWAIERVIRPVLMEMQRRGAPYAGFLYAGLMLDPELGIHVLEFNARLGDPETQVIMRRLESDLVDILAPLAAGQPAATPRWSDERAVCVVLAAAGYPGKVRSGDRISGIDFAESMPGIVVFHAGTALDEGQRLVSAGGRVLNVTATGLTQEEARSRVYRAADVIQFPGVQLRRDIGAPTP